MLWWSRMCYGEPRWTCSIWDFSIFNCNYLY